MIRSILQPSQPATESYRFPVQSRPVRLLAVAATFTSADTFIRPTLDFEFAGVAPIAEILGVVIQAPLPDNILNYARAFDTTYGSNSGSTIGMYRAPLPDLIIDDKVSVTLSALDPNAADVWGYCHWVFEDFVRDR